MSKGFSIKPSAQQSLAISGRLYTADVIMKGIWAVAGLAFNAIQMSLPVVLLLKAKPKLISVKAPVPIPYCPADYKLRFNFSVESLAYLIKLLVNANIIEPGIKAELLRYVAANFQTPGTKMGGIAAGSFQTKYKNVS